MELVGSDRGLVGEVASVHGPPSLQTRFPFRETSVSSHTAPPPPASWVCPPAPRPRRGAPKGLHLVFQESLLVPCALPSLVTDSCCGHPVAREDPQGTSSPYTPHSCQPQACSLPSVSFHVPRHLPFGVLGPALRASQCSRVPGGPAGAAGRCLSRVTADPPPRCCPGAAPSRSLAALPPGPGLVSGPTLPFEYSLSGSPKPRGHVLRSLHCCPDPAPASTAGCGSGLCPRTHSPESPPQCRFVPILKAYVQALT